MPSRIDIYRRPLRYQSPQAARRRARARARSRLAALLLGLLVVSAAGAFLWRHGEGQATLASVAVTAASASPSPSPALQPTAQEAVVAAPSPAATPIPTAAPTAQPASVPAASTAGLAAAVKSAIGPVVAANPGISFGITYVDLTSGERSDISGDVPHTAASTAKVLAAVMYLAGVQRGAYSLSDNLDGYSASWQLQQMINQSNNDSWDAFNDLLGLSNEQAYARSLGLESYDWRTNSISSNDMATLLQKLYSGQLLNAENTKLLLGYMQRTNDEALIPPGIPSGVNFYHKYGEYEDAVNDVAIVEYGSAPFILTIYSDGNGTYQYDQRAAMFHAIEAALFKAVSS